MLDISPANLLLGSHCWGASQMRNYSLAGNFFVAYLRYLQNENKRTTTTLVESSLKRTGKIKFTFYMQPARCFSLFSHFLLSNQVENMF